MDIQKFETAYLNAGGKSSELEKEDGEYTSSKAQMAWEMWQVAKAQSLPEGFVLVLKELPEDIAENMAKKCVVQPRRESNPIWIKIEEGAYKSRLQTKKWELWRDYKTMIEAQEQIK